MHHASLIEQEKTMSTPFIEHVNLTVHNPEQRAQVFMRLFDWHIRWQGDAMNGGTTVHVGDERCYLALYTPRQFESEQPQDSHYPGSLNHVALQVDDLDLIEQRVLDEGFETFNHGDYDPGRRFYFLDPDGIEFEIVQY